MKACPTCGHPLPEDIISGVHLSPMQSRILRIVSRASPAGISINDLASMVYADDPEGGPNNASVTIRTHVYFINRKIAERGLRIKGCGGYRLQHAA